MSAFQHVRLELAREPGYPHGDPASGWDFVAALDDEGHLDLAACLAEPERCRVNRFRQDATVATGYLRHTSGGRWTFDLKARGTLDETGFTFGDERFVLGDCVTLVAPDGKPHSYGVERIRTT